MSSNNEIFSKKLRKFSTEKVTPEIMSGLGVVAERIVSNIENGAVPEWTSNLMNSTGVGVYGNGSLVKYVPIKTAIIPRPGKSIYGVDAEDRDYWGVHELDKALAAASGTYSNGVWIVLFSTMPYAEIQEEEKGYFSRLIAALLRETNIGFKNLKIDLA